MYERSHTCKYNADVKSSDSAMEHICPLPNTSRGLLRSALHTRICVLACLLFHPVLYLWTGRRHLCVTSGVCNMWHQLVSILHRVMLVNCDFNKKCWWESFFPGSQSCSLPCCPPVLWWTTPQRQRAGSPKWSWVPTFLLLLLLRLSQMK